MSDTRTTHTHDASVMSVMSVMMSSDTHTHTHTLRTLDAMRSDDAVRSDTHTHTQHLTECDETYLPPSDDASDDATR